MSCDNRQDLLLLYVAGALEDAELAELRRHLATGCPICAGRLAEAEAVYANLGAMAKPVAPSPAIKQKLMQRVRDNNPARADSLPFSVSKSPASSAGKPWPWLAAAAALLIGSGITYFIMAGQLATQRQDMQSLRATLAQRDLKLDQLTAQLTTTINQVRLLQSPAVKVVNLQGTEAQPQGQARIFWDTTTSRWHFFAAGLKPLPAGKTYELWFINDKSEKLPIGTFNVNAQGEATLEVAIKDHGVLAVAAVTDEPAGGSPQPTGTIQLAGKP